MAKHLKQIEIASWHELTPSSDGLSKVCRIFLDRLSHEPTNHDLAGNVSVSVSKYDAVRMRTAPLLPHSHGSLKRGLAA